MRLDQPSVIGIMVLTMAEALEGQDSCMMREENRLASFNGWPINEGLCVPANVSSRLVTSEIYVRMFA